MPESEGAEEKEKKLPARPVGTQEALLRVGVADPHRRERERERERAERNLRDLYCPAVRPDGEHASEG